MFIRRSMCIQFSAFVVCVILSAKFTLAQPGGLAYVVVARAVEEELVEGRTYVATVVPSRKATIGSAIDGRVSSFPLNEGDRVKKGATLAQLLTSTISKEYEAAEARLKLRKVELEELKNGSRPQEIQQSKATMEARLATAEFLKKRLARLEELRQKSITTADEIQEVESAFLAANKRLDESKAMYEMVKEGPRKEDIVQKDAEVAEQKAIVDKLDDQKTKHTIVTRFDGFITKEFTEEGAWVNRGDPIVTVVALDQVDLLTNVVESDIRHLKIGLSARVEIGALPEKLWTGKVHAIIPDADPRSRTFPVKIRVDNEFLDSDNQPCDPDDADKAATPCQPLIKSGMLATITLPVGKTQKGILVPKDALVLGGPKPQLWVVDGKVKSVEGTAGKGSGAKEAAVNKIDVKLGIAEGNWIQVSGDVKKDDIVVVEGNERIFAPNVTWNPNDEIRFKKTRSSKPSKLRTKTK